ncbi:MAG: hypothetical protein UX17_C0019G0002 [Parcubacteria group bacterium GW2011_GWC2_45_7]|nr:MAG: hypothetical protein UX17_C0019G0002 [Parcubacteria group bacterium GW2011_GWC2_45_7]
MILFFQIRQVFGAGNLDITFSPANQGSVIFGDVSGFAKSIDLKFAAGGQVRLGAEIAGSDRNFFGFSGNDGIIGAGGGGGNLDFGIQGKFYFVGGYNSAGGERFAAIGAAVIDSYLALGFVADGLFPGSIGSFLSGFGNGYRRGRQDGGVRVDFLGRRINGKAGFMI